MEGRSRVSLKGGGNEVQVNRGLFFFSFGNAESTESRGIFYRCTMAWTS